MSSIHGNVEYQRRKFDVNSAVASVGRQIVVRIVNNGNVVQYERHCNIALHINSIMMNAISSKIESKKSKEIVLIRSVHCWLRCHRFRHSNSHRWCFSQNQIRIWHAPKHPDQIQSIWWWFYASQMVVRISVRPRRLTLNHFRNYALASMRPTHHHIQFRRQCARPTNCCILQCQPLHNRTNNMCNWNKTALIWRLGLKWYVNPELTISICEFYMNDICTEEKEKIRDSMHFGEIIFNSTFGGFDWRLNEYERCFVFVDASAMQYRNHFCLMENMKE